MFVVIEDNTIVASRLMKIIFLDFDGVMATDYYSLIMEKNSLPERDEFGVFFDPQCVECLSQIIEQTSADIVVTSSWQDLMSYQDITRMWLSRKLPGYVTDLIPLVNKRRGDNIDAWIKECGPLESYLILDDLPIYEFNDHHLNHMIKVDSYRGLQDTMIEMAVAILTTPFRVC